MPCKRTIQKIKRQYNATVLRVRVIPVPMEETDTETTTRARAKRRNYALELKVSAIEEAKKSSKKRSAEKFRVPRTCIRQWCAQETAIREGLASSLRAAKRSRLSGGGRHVAMTDLEHLY